ncbi:phage minor head protein [Actinacidiphila sp. ITFR-21]|uniref:phage minor head protein n=1 Tax=Actinacidiphila sp. ITFR-21 TaxID=3075199 RepID=UPI00288AAEF4|nr:phage minor head protein [Streptomyces sp. ITFR-21]WNI20406.1 phage minor head protein [Streptomyces sp. ITFR-21]
MPADDLEDALSAAEDDIAAAVADLLDQVADEFAAALADATEIVAARFSVSRIARMWAAGVPALVRRLLGTAETAAGQAADQVDAELPDGWDDLPGRYDDDRELPDGISQYVTTTEHLLRAVGDRLSAAAVAALSEGVDAGEDIEQLRTRLRGVFARDGAQLGEVREDRVARTEAGRAWNTATLAAGQALTGPERPLVKQWRTRDDSVVRDAHAEVNGQLRLLDEPFTVSGVSMSTPGDPAAPPELTVNCRCRLALAHADRTAAFESQEASEAELSDARRNPSMVSMTADTDGSHLSGGMIALIPTEEDAARLAIEGGEDAAELHLTLFFLDDDGSVWTDEQRRELTANLQDAAAQLGGPITANAFGAAQWNPSSDSPSWVWSVGDNPGRDADAPTLVLAQAAATGALENMHDQPALPAQHSPWAAHVCAAYSDDPALLEQLLARVGPITFDRIRLALAGDHTDIPLSPEEEPPMAEPTAAAITAALPARSWSTPGDTAIAFENQETGDGRVFAPESLYWDQPGPWPLQYADEMLMGHEGAELAGAIETVDRDGDRITASGVLYAGRSAADEAIDLLEEEAPLGVSVDLDDVSMEFVDRTLATGDDGEIVLAASLASVSVLRLADDSWVVTASTAAEWTASGTALTRTRHDVQFITGPGGLIPATALRNAFTNTGVLTAAAGDADNPEDGVVVWAENSGDFLMRITRARLRGATLVSMPAYSQARIVLDPITADGEQEATATGLAAANVSDTHLAVVAFVSSSSAPVGPREVATALGISTESARGYLKRAAEAGRIIRLARGQYVGTTFSEAPDVAASGDDDQSMRDLVASAWTAMQDSDPMPAAWFAEPTADDLPPGSGGVHHKDGRIFGWVAQAGEPHAGMPGRNLTIESLGDIDLTHFLRARFKLDNGQFVRAGAMTMNVGHHRDGAECETSACQFDDSRTVAGIVTVGMNSRGMWFSGAAAPWLSEWDRTVFAACQPSYHMRQDTSGQWQLRAVLSVPVPGHSSPLLASVTERSNLALAASAASALLTSPDTASGRDARPQDTSGQPVPGPAADMSGQASSIADAVTAALTSPRVLDGLLAALERRETERAEEARAEVARLIASVAPARGELAASAAGTTRKEVA